MALRRTWRWALDDFRHGLAPLDPSKLMIAPILFVCTLALVDRAVYETARMLFPEEPERMTRLS